MLQRNDHQENERMRGRGGASSTSIYRHNVHLDIEEGLPVDSLFQRGAGQHDGGNGFAFQSADGRALREELEETRYEQQ